MIGEGYWSTGITVRWYADGDQWRVSLRFLDDGFCEDGSTEGTLVVRYLMHDLGDALDLLKADAERLGIRWAQVPQCPTIYMEADGEADDIDYPIGWQKIVNDQIRRLGWKLGYDEPVMA